MAIGIAIHDHWPDWFNKYVERKIAEGGGKFEIKVPPYRLKVGRKLGEALREKRDQELIELLKDN